MGCFTINLDRKTIDGKKTAKGESGPTPNRLPVQSRQKTTVLTTVNKHKVSSDTNKYFTNGKGVFVLNIVFNDHNDSQKHKFNFNLLTQNDNYVLSLYFATGYLLISP